jgi:1-acyl-sn-glycerol-3-phosphate acyltransferase
MIRIFWKTYMRLTGWKIVGRFPYELDKLIIIVAPHTTWKDVVIGLCVRSVLRIRNARFLGKKELFDGPFGWFFRLLGGTPVDRFSSKGMVGQVADLFRQHEKFILAIAPEGTRQRVDKLRSGFYHIAREARVPILMTGFDFGKKEVVLSEPFYTTGNEEADFAHIIGYFSDFTGADPSKDLRHLKAK